MKNVFIFLVIMIVSTFNSSCKDNKEEEMDDQPLGGYFSGSVNLRIKDKTGTDMLDPSNPSSLKKFKIYYLLNGKKELYSRPLMYGPSGYIIEKFASDSYYHMQIFLNSPAPESNNDDEWTTLLEFEDGSTDTIKASFVVKPGYIAVEKASYNDKVAWDLSNNGALNTFELIKL